MTGRNLLGFAALVLAAVGSWYMTGSLRGPALVDAPRSTQGDRFYLKSARVLGTDDTGRPLYEIEAEYAEQLPNEDIEFQVVKISYSPDASIPWTLHADSATIGSKEGNQVERVILSGHVVAISPQGLSGEVTEIRTSYLEFDPVTYMAETDRRVQIRVGSRSLTATGMLASLREDRLQLRSNVSGKFVP